MCSIPMMTNTKTPPTMTELEEMPKYLRVRALNENPALKAAYIDRVRTAHLKKETEKAQRRQREMEPRKTASTGPKTASRSNIHRVHSLHDEGCSCGNYGGPGSLCIGR